ncbi:MAG: hypothetical protein ACFE91_00620 [Promethearchaeota archaeon]
MLNNNEECNWSDFLDDPLKFNLATLSKYMKKLMANEHVEKKEKGLYKVTPEGRKRYFDLRFKDSFDRKLKFPPEIILNKRNYEHIILWMLFNNNYCKWSDFLEKPLSINHNSLSKNLNLLLKKKHVKKYKSKYRITKLGESEYDKILKFYDLDYQSILEEEVKGIEKLKKTVNAFLEKYDVKNNNIKVIFFDLFNLLDYTKTEKSLATKEDFYKVILYLSINHPNNYPDYILPEEFSVKYNIKIPTLNFLIQNIVEENLYHIKFFKFISDSNATYYFRENEKIEQMIYLILDENIIKYSYLNKLQPGISDDKKVLETATLLDNISIDVCNKLFDKTIIRSLKKFLQQYIRFIYLKFQRDSRPHNLMDKFKGIAYQNLLNLDLNEFNNLTVGRRKIIPFLMEFPKYVILDEVRRKLKE